MSETIFSKIAKREIPAHIIYEDEKYMAFLDINPKTKGHALLITKEPYTWVLDVPEFGEYFEVAKVVAQKIEKALNPIYISFQTFGVEIPHAHIHIVPFYSMTEKWQRTEMTNEELKELSEKIKNG